MIRRYFDAVRSLLDQQPGIETVSLLLEERTAEVGLVQGDVMFVDGSRLHIREYVHASPGAASRFMYVYHYQRPDGTLVFRYDNSRHFPHLPGAPHHKHVGAENVVASSAEPELAAILDEIERLLADE